MKEIKFRACNVATIPKWKPVPKNIIYQSVSICPGCNCMTHTLKNNRFNNATFSHK